MSIQVEETNHVLNLYVDKLSSTPTYSVKIYIEDLSKKQIVC